MTDPGVAAEAVGKDGIQKSLVLVVDDEPINLQVLEKMLTSAGFDVVTAGSGPECREKVRICSPDIILLDVMMPGENGFETCVELKRDTACRDIPLIFVSALSDVANKVRGLELGAVDYVSKPFEKSEVLARIRVHLKLKRAMRALIEEQTAKLRTLSEAQRSILVDPAACPEAGFAVRYSPAQEAGGDFYDVFALGTGAYCYFVADICGHDLGASLVTSSLKALLRQNSGPLYTPVETMETMNSILRGFLRNGRYVTAQSVHLDRRLRTATVVSAGHPPPIHVPAKGAPVLLEAEGDILGVFPSVYLEQRVVALSKGDRLYLYTDGLMEWQDADGQGRQRGSEALIRLCGETMRLPLENAMTTVFDGMFAGREKLDDVVLLGVEV